MSERVVKMSISMPSWLAAALKKIAESRGVSKSEIIRHALEEYIEKRYPDLLPNIA